MSKSLNLVLLIGHLGADAEVRSTSNGGRVATLSVATGRQWRGADGTKQEKTEWHRVILWNNPNGAKLADLVEKYTKKGDKIHITGYIEYRTYEDKEGVKKYTTEIVAREVILLSGMDASEGTASKNEKFQTTARKGQKQEAIQEEDDDLPF